MVALDDRRIAFSALDHVGIYRTLRKYVDLSELLCLVFKNSDKLLADYLALLFGLGYSRKL